MPDKMHLTVPKGFKKKISPAVLQLHQENLSKDEIKKVNGYTVTTPLKTLVDIIKSKRIEEDFVRQGITQALEKGLITKQKVLQIRDQYPEASKMLEILNEKKL